MKKSVKKAFFEGRKKYLQSDEEEKDRYENSPPYSTRLLKWIYWKQQESEDPE